MINKDIRICLHPYLYETDLQGSVRVVTDAVADSLVQSMEYLPDSVAFLYGNSLTMHYTADGRRMSTPSVVEALRGNYPLRREM